ncbi:hypothetical protein QYM36_004749, partial [Artemia franciscana]
SYTIHRKHHSERLVNYLQYAVDYFWSKFASDSIVICGIVKAEPSWLESCLSLKQVVKSPTRGSNLLDMVFTNLEQCYKEPKITISIDLSEQLTVIWRLSHLPRRKAIKKTATYLPIKDEQISGIKEKLALQNWTFIYRQPLAEDMTNTFCDKRFLRKIKYARKQHGRLTVQYLLSSTPKKLHSTAKNILG